MPNGFAEAQRNSTGLLTAVERRVLLALAHHLFDLLGRLPAVLPSTSLLAPTLLRHHSPPVRYLAMLSRLCLLRLHRNVLEPAAYREQNQGPKRGSRHGTRQVPPRLAVWPRWHRAEHRHDQHDKQNRDHIASFSAKQGTGRKLASGTSAYLMEGSDGR